MHVIDAPRKVSVVAITLSWTSFNQSMTLPVAAGQNSSASATGNAGGAITLKYGADNGRVLEQLPIDVSVTGANQTATRFVLHSGASLFYEEDVKANGSVEARAYLTGPLGVVAVHTTPSANSGPATLTYWHRDHLGSLTVTTNETGQIKERMRFDPWGKPMTPLGARSGRGDRGFTGHEHLAGGLIHMNGRIYDPVLGRFISADVVVQFPDAITSYNRYGYVMNNPLGYTDPSGYLLGIDDAIMAIVLMTATVASVGAAMVQSYRGNDLNAERWMFAAMFFATAGATGPVANVLQGFAAGGLQSGSIEGAIMGAMTAGALQGLGAIAKDVLGSLGAFAGPANNATSTESFAHTMNQGGGSGGPGGGPGDYAGSGHGPGIGPPGPDVPLRVEKVAPIEITACRSIKCADPLVRAFTEAIMMLGASSASAVRGAPRYRPMHVFGFPTYYEFQTAMSELQTALRNSGIVDAKVGVRGSAVSGKSYKTGEPFGPKSDIDVFAESKQLTESVPTRPKGIAYDRDVQATYPELQAWSERWSEITGRDVKVAGWRPGSLPANEPYVKLK